MSRVMSTVLALFLVAGSTSPACAQDLVAHEWGSAIQVQGSDGVSLDGLEENLAELPAFVVRWGKLPLRSAYPFKKPILYLYAKEAMDVRVVVRCPTGVFTEWWPPAHGYLPYAPYGKGGPLTRYNEKIKPEKGLLEWKLKLHPTRPTKPKPRVGMGWYPILREVDAAWLHAYREQQRWKGKPAPPPINELERFLLYRGVMNSGSPIELEVRSEGGGLKVTNQSSAEATKVLVVRVGRDQGTLQVLPRVPAGGTGLAPVKAMAAFSIPELRRRGTAALLQQLVHAGMYEKEAKGMLRIWGPEWFGAPGVRVLYLLPRKAIDRALPLSITPKPKSLVRVMVGRIEVLTPEREKAIETWIKGLGSDVVNDRDKAFAELKALGRMAEPLLRRALTSSSDPEVRSRVEKLLVVFNPVRRAQEK